MPDRDAELHRLLTQYQQQVKPLITDGNLKWSLDPESPPGSRAYMARCNGGFFVIVVDDRGHADGAATFGFSNFHLTPEDSKLAAEQAGKQNDQNQT